MNDHAHPPIGHADLDDFRRAQTLAYDCALAVEKELTEGMTEKQAAALMHDWLHDHGIRHYLHKPFAWFGDRTAFAGLWTPLHFFPSNHRLEAGMPVILDVAPILDGCAADIGYSCALGENRVLARMQQDLLLYRQLILDGIRTGLSLRSVYEKVDELSVRLGYHNAHKKYPQQVLAHRVTRLPVDAQSETTVAGFGLPALQWLLGNTLKSVTSKQQQSPLWNGSSRSDFRPQPGLWAVEPHIAFHGTGAKFEEILVIQHDDAFWLDDTPPHLRRLQTPNSATRANTEVATLPADKTAPETKAPVKKTSRKKPVATAKNTDTRARPSRKRNPSPV